MPPFTLLTMPAATVTPHEGEPGSPKGRIVSSVAEYSQDKVTLQYKQNDCTLSVPSHPHQGSPPPRHRPYAAYCRVSDLTKRPTTEQPPAPSKHINHTKRHVDLTQSPQSLRTENG